MKACLLALGAVFVVACGGGGEALKAVGPPGTYEVRFDNGADPQNLRVGELYRVSVYRTDGGDSRVFGATITPHYTQGSDQAGGFSYDSQSGQTLAFINEPGTYIGEFRASLQGVQVDSIPVRFDTGPQFEFRIVLTREGTPAAGLKVFLLYGNTYAETERVSDLDGTIWLNIGTNLKEMLIMAPNGVKVGGIIYGPNQKVPIPPQQANSIFQMNIEVLP